MKLFVAFAGPEEEVRFVVLIDAASTVASLRQRIQADFRSVFPSRLPVVFFRMASADGFFLTDAAVVGQVLEDGSTVTCHRADSEVTGAPLPEEPSLEEVRGIFASFRAQISYIARMACHAALKSSSEVSSEAMSILLAMLMLGGPQLLQVRSDALDILQKRLPAQDGAALPAFLAAGGLFVLLGLLSPSTKLDSDTEVLEKTAQLFEQLVLQHGPALAPVLEDCQANILMQKLAKDSRCTARMKQNAYASRKALEKVGIGSAAGLKEGYASEPGKLPTGERGNRLQSAGAAVARGGYSPAGCNGGERTPTPILPGGMTLRLLLDQKKLTLDSSTLSQAVWEFEAKVTSCREGALHELAADSGLAEVVWKVLQSATKGAAKQLLPSLGKILARFRGEPRARTGFVRQLSRFLRFSEALEVLPSCWTHLPESMRSAMLDMAEEMMQHTAKSATHAHELQSVLVLLQEHVPSELQALALRMMRRLVDPDGVSGASSAALSRMPPKAINTGLMHVMPKHPLACLDILGTLVLKEDFRRFFASQASLLKFLAHCCTQPEVCARGTESQGPLSLQRAACRCLANLASQPEVRDWAKQSPALQGLHESTGDLTVRAYLGKAQKHSKWEELLGHFGVGTQAASEHRFAKARKVKSFTDIAGSWALAAVDVQGGHSNVLSLIRVLAIPGLPKLAISCLLLLAPALALKGRFRSVQTVTQCTSPAHSVEGGYVVFEASTFKDSFDVTAKCAERYKGTAVVSPCTADGAPYTLRGCSPERCTEPVAADMKGYELAPFSLERPSFSVTVKCTSGVGFGKATECVKDGDPYTVTGCLVGECTSPAANLASHGYVVYERSRMPQSFNVSATCASGYKGTASASTCKAAGTPYSLAGCEPETCTPPSTEHMKGYELQAFSLKRPSFSVTVKCSSGVGVGKAKPCARDGEPYTLGGCFIGECASPVAHASQGYIVYEGSKMPHSFHVTASCAKGYKGTAAVSVCKDADAPYSLTGCAPEVCTEPSPKETDGYELTAFSLERPSFSVSVRCKSGIGLGRAKECTKHGEPYTVEGCFVGECTSPSNLAEHGYVVYEGSRMPHSFNVRAECATGYKGTALVTQCEKTEQPYSLNGCSPESCIEPSVFDQANYDIQIHSLLRPFFRVTAKCKHGFGTATVKECRKDGNPFELEGCMDACASPKKAVEAGYVVFEKKLVLNEFSVSASCADGYKGAAAVTKCNAANEPYILSGCTPVRCTEPTHVDKAAYELTVLSAEMPSFSILANCKSGVGTAKARACSGDGQPFILEGCPSLCSSPKKDSEAGYLVFEKSLLMGEFEAHAVCADGYAGTATVSKCTAANEPYILSGCKPVKCAEPSNAAAYDLTVFSAEAPSFSIVAKCRNSAGTGKAKACSKEGQPFVLEGCPSMCSSPKRTSEDGYVVFEKSLFFDDFRADAVCADGYTGKASVGKCSAVSLPYTLGGCAPAKCVEPTAAQKFNYNVLVHSLNVPSFHVTVTCRNGSGAGKAVPCRGDNLPYKLEGCD
ncbi:APX7 [Symbiodinium natans]|uniref:APX7 protein n=1 Tax=Symbiodinium natans TaxID=878477 RepID=A0A812GY57_9DINO|nr:APX7 [Symbiodinium natans]